jgi:hypothetical protein
MLVSGLPVARDWAIAFSRGPAPFYMLEDFSFPYWHRFGPVGPQLGSLEAESITGTFYDKSP